MPITWQAPGVSCGGTFDIKVELGFEAEVVVVCGGGQGGRPRPIVEVTVVVRADESACPSDLATARTPTSRIETTATARSSTSESLPEASVQPLRLGGREMDAEICARSSRALATAVLRHPARQDLPASQAAGVTLESCGL